MRSCNEIIEKIKEYRNNFDEKIIEKAYNYAKEKHEGQFRKSGEPYFSHPAEVAYILAELKMDIQTIVAGLLHDVVEDTDATIEEIEKLFGKEIAFIVAGVTKLEQYQFSSKEERNAESFRKLLISLSEDIRVLIVKLADRLHNMRTLDGRSPNGQKRTANETLTIYAPLANRLGLYKIKNELEDLSLKYLEPEIYKEIEEKLKKKKKVISTYLSEIIETVKKKLKENGIEGTVQWRFKHIYGIYNKMVKKGIPFEEIYDIAGIRIITDTVPNCYVIAGIIHSLWMPVPGRLKDYIAVPKPNMYQSLHTTVVGPRGQFIEFQIRTWKMHQVAEMGIAAHWKYKEGGGKLSESERERFLWLRNLLEWVKEEKDTKEFMENVKSDLYEEDIYVFTPKGDLKTLPKGATPVDFAYSIHTSIGHRCIGAKVNGKLVSLNHILKSGDKVEIITGNNENPKRDWLTFVKTSKARTAIKSFIKKQENERAKKLGESILEKYLRKYIGKGINYLYENDFSAQLKSLGYSNIEYAIVDVGFGKLDGEKLVRRLLNIQEEQEKKRKTSVKKEDADIIIDGIENILVNLGKCCNPLPGDEVIGVVTKGRGIVVHTINCVVAQQIMESSPGRILTVNFKPSDKLYQAKIRVFIEDRPGMLAAVSSKIGDTKTNIIGAYTRTIGGRAILDFTVQVKDKTQLEKVMNAIKMTKGVLNVKRIRREKVKIR
ncbi:RelA/SpoT family protein [Desulfurobacterium atlanticum]|uniref:GTP pyrophosphokinase n=1 Tax=Desulfurobacterium atlanticum TaxID=240169 RepID=A0A238YWV4_9BACT|nr:bifunctional (p)ppGpp synthetase/guanosine-3',5'-bis(diphosphate) 3'-pyrophosphohydrolase [Desulfurobacterium atlanticum]SNR75134.1 GTP pyrophosphokinase [Desulfurobacterium atlanticum]